MSLTRFRTRPFHHLRRIRRSVSKPVMQSLVVALILTRLDYGNATLAGLANQSLVKLLSVLNAATRLIFLSRKFDHVTPLLRELHWLWLSFPERISYKLALLVFKCLNGLAPPYLACEFRESSAAALDVESGTHNTTSPSRNHRWSRFPGHGCKSMEQSTIKCDIIVMFESFQVSLENWVVYAMLLSWLTLTYCAHLSHAHWLCVTVSWLYVTLIAIVFIIIIISHQIPSAFSKLNHWRSAQLRWI